MKINDILLEFTEKPENGPGSDDYEDLLFHLAWEIWSEAGDSAQAERKLSLLGWKPEFGDDYTAIVLYKIGSNDHRQYTIDDFEEYDQQGVAEARASSASFRSGNAQRAEVNAMSPEERKAHEDKRAEQQRKRDDARMERERERNAAKKGLAEADPLNRARQRVQSQGFTASPEERNADRLASRRRWEEKFDKIHADFMNRGGVSGLYSDEEKAHQAQQRMARDEHETQRRRDNHDDDRATTDMFRDRLNRYQWSSQRDVDPEQLAAISNITYTPRERNKVKEANKFFKPGPATTGKFPEPRERKPGQAWSKSETLGKDGKIYHWQDPRAKQDVTEAPGAETLDHNQSTVASNLNSLDLGEGNKKPEQPEADYGDDYQAMVSRVKKLAGMGPLKTVYDPTKRVYKNIPTAVQPKK